ncbi:MAG: peptidase M1, partial [Flavobacteriales bacterium]|nr:peptidase M1 [Flavobacteriales bacterium]
MKKYFILVLLFIPALKAQAQYWQQHAEYYMDFKIDVSDFSFTGEQELVYTNNSPDTITKVYYHLFFNAFRPGSQMDVRSRTIRDPDSRIGSRIFELEEKDYGELNVFSLKQNGRSLEISQRETILLSDSSADKYAQSGKAFAAEL